MIENTILSSLVYNDDYSRKVLPYLNIDYFFEIGYKIVLKLIKDHYSKYNKMPTIDSLAVDLDTAKLSEINHEHAKEVLGKLANAPVDQQWLIDNTEEFCKKQAFFLAVSKAAELIDSDKGSSAYGASMDLIQDALSVTFDNHIGHDYVDDAEDRLDYYHMNQNKLPCNLETFNNILRGGFVEKSLTVFLLPTGKGKSTILCHFAASFLQDAKNVLYISLEMPEEQVAARIDANILGIPLEDLDRIDRAKYMHEIIKLRKKTLGKLIIKEYPPHTAHVGHLRHLLNELRLKKKFVPDAIMVDYLGVFGSMKSGRDDNSYQRLKTAAEEVRGIGMEFNCRTFTAMQVNKEGTKNIDFDITDTAESWGVPHTADYMFGGISTDELEAMHQMKIKRLKDRHNKNGNQFGSFVVGIDRDRMRLFDIDQPESTAEAPKTKSKFADMIV